MSTNGKDDHAYGVDFIPVARMRRYAGDFPLLPAQYKLTPRDFVVEEKEYDGHQTTVGTQSDFAPDELENRRGRFVACTLVLEKLTTSAGAKKLAWALNIGPNLISFAGNKDRTATTSQPVVIAIDDIDHVRRNSFPDLQVLREKGFFIKDVRRTDRILNKGQLQGNRFHIKLMVKGMNKAALTAYLEPRLQTLLAIHGDGNQPYIPNFFWKQRLGRRQDLDDTGATLITEGLEKGIQKFICKAVPDKDHHVATKLRRQLAQMWDEMVKAAQEKGERVEEQYYSFMAMAQLMERQQWDHGKMKPGYEIGNMFIEHTLATEMAKSKNFEEMIRRNSSVKNDVSLWVGAYQSYWFNQVLGRVLDCEIPRSALEVGERDNELLIPLWYPGDPKSVAFYERVCPEAIPHHVDPAVRRLFLTEFRGKRGPRRPAFITVKELDYSVHDEMVSFKFLLRSGSYATNFLSLLFDLDGQTLESMK